MLFWGFLTGKAGCTTQTHIGALIITYAILGLLITIMILWAQNPILIIKAPILTRSVKTMMSTGAAEDLRRRPRPIPRPPSPVRALA